MKNKIPSEGLRLGRDSGSILCDTLKKWRFRTGWGGYYTSEDYERFEEYLYFLIKYLSQYTSHIYLETIPLSVNKKEEYPKYIFMTNINDYMY